jgi:hypothetical protein
MNAVRVEADGELRLTDLPCRRGDKVEAIVRILERPFQPAPDAGRDAALDRFLALARSSAFRSAGPYPSRDELHERPMPTSGCTATTRATRTSSKSPSS